MLDWKGIIKTANNGICDKCGKKTENIFFCDNCHKKLFKSIRLKVGLREEVL